ncbi:uncharacterized protein SOCE26_030140 [Sorangium cellulosum]|uniref:Uncharacterized protein n=1 Tax=Sorangium cellulosum TaxID=56 RepID=A0A2L0EQL2_SORCE|nr:hypothetical protein [Sorangium cellulosum]AUX41593.1 uncharacterized protein SOCE26_030140 [Sorangium cellulosum]
MELLCRDGRGGWGGRDSRARRATRRGRARVACLVAAAAGALAGACTSSRPPAADDVPPGPYEVVDGWPRVPEGVVFGPALDVAVDGRGRVLVSHAAGRGSGNDTPIDEPTILVFDPETGELLDAWGAGLFVYPHGLEVDRNDFVWVTDSERDRVFKLTAEGSVVMTLGEVP